MFPFRILIVIGIVSFTFGCDLTLKSPDLVQATNGERLFGPLDPLGTKKLLDEVQRKDQTIKDLEHENLILKAQSEGKPAPKRERKKAGFVASRGNAPEAPDSYIAWGARPVELRVYYGTVVNGFELIADDGSKATIIGYEKAPYRTIPLVQGEYITRMEGKLGNRIDWVKVYTSKHPEGYGPYGNAQGGDSEWHIDVPRDAQVVGFYGNTGKVTDKFGFWIEIPR